MRKKFKLLALILICITALTACGQEKAPTRIQTAETGEDMKVASATWFMLITEVMAQEDVDAFSNYTENEADRWADSAAQRYEMTNGAYIRVEPKIVAAGYESYQNALEQLGENVTPAEFDSEGMPIVVLEQKNPKEAIANIPLKGSLRTGSMEIIFDRNLNITSINTNVDLTLGESMKKAGTNTMIGMGTVFVMLVVISFIIRALAIIPKLQAMGSKKETSVDNAISGIIEREESGASETVDDGELIAVIAAAIAAAEGSNPASASGEGGFTVRSIRRIR
ncbi:MAG: OadG family protein [Lachnospiraceae bacterium]|nr:OadG family protein [Lachnospiraceae bacterium]